MSRNSDYAALALRVTSGALFVAHGLMKVFIFTIPGTVAFFESLGLPGVLAYLTIAAEIVGGAALILGVGTRAASLLLIPVLLGATWVHSGNGWVFSAQGGGWEYPLYLIILSVTQALLGDGAYALKPSRSLSLSPAPALKAAA